MLVFEHDIYPAFTVGDGSKIIEALEKLIEFSGGSSGEADIVFRAMNWAWPALTSRARTNSAEGVQIVERFTRLMSVLIARCSVSFLPSISQCKLVLRAVSRGIGFIDPCVAVEYLRAMEEKVLPQKGVRGYLLDKGSVEQFIALSNSAEDIELAEVTDKLLEKIFRGRRFFSTDLLVELLVRLIKTRACSAEVAKLVARVLSWHNSAQLYDSLMDKLTFIKFGGEPSTVKKLRLINFFIELIGSGGRAGLRLPASISKSELTSNILNLDKNKLVGIFTLRLYRVILSRFPDNFEACDYSTHVRDKLVEISSLIPLMKKNVSKNASPDEILCLIELSGVVCEFNRTFRGSFFDCKFDWLKLLDEENESAQDVRISDILVRMIFSIYKSQVPITNQIGKMWTRFSCISKLESVHMCFGEWLGRFGSPDETKILMKLVIAGSLPISDLANRIVDILVNRPADILASTSTGSESVLRTILQLIEIDFSLKEKFVKRLDKKRKLNQIDHLVVPQTLQRDHNPIETEQVSLPRALFSKKVLPLPRPVSDPYELVLSHWSTVVFAKSLNEEISEVDLIDLISSNKLYSAILSLSCCDDRVRSCAFGALAVVLRALALCIEAKGVNTRRFAFREAPQVAMILTWLRNGIEPPPSSSDEHPNAIPDPLPLVTTVFVVEAIRILFQPKHALYTSLVKHLLARPAINATSDIQMWDSLFFSTDAANLGIFRQWILEIVKIGAQDKVSIDIMIRRGVIEAVLESAIHLNGNADEFLACVEIIAQILKTLSKNDKEETASFIKRFSLCQWISFVSATRWIKFDTS